MNKYDNIMIGKKTTEEIRERSLGFRKMALLDEINAMIAARHIMDEIELQQALCDRKVYIFDEYTEDLSSEETAGYVAIDSDLFDQWVKTVNSGREEVGQQKERI
jgi:hypothetical protein